jgi:GT2 family glycosyltransferase
MHLVSIILVNYNSAAIIKDCLQSLRQFNQTIPSEVIVVDNASQDASPEIIAEYFPEVTLIRETINHGFGKGNNIGARVARGEFILFLNTDTIATCDFLPSLLEVMAQDHQVGIVAPQLVNRDGSLQISTSPAISVRGEYLAQKRSHQYRRGRNLKKITQSFAHQQEVDIVVGAALLIRRKLFEQLRGFDERFFMYFEESDLCQRSQYLGWRIIYYPHVSLIHLHGESTKKTLDRMVLEYRRSQIYYYQKHRPLWEQKFLQIYLLIKFGLRWLLSRLTTAKEPNKQSLNNVNHQIILMVLNSGDNP